MLYIFHVDTGTMMTFDMNLAMENVAVLQSVITQVCHISEDKQVLLISGGESLDPRQRVAKYSAGTDTNPIFLFSKSTIEAATPPSPSIHYGSGTRYEGADVDLQSQVEGSLLMPPAYDTVVSRTQLAVQFRDVDQDEMKACECLVHDQHLQQQGWAAVIANLEDITSALSQRWELFQEVYNQYLSTRQRYLDTLASINESLDLLSKIPLLSCLSAPLGLSMSYTTSSSHARSPVTTMPELSTCQTLYEWISSQDPQHSLHDMVEQCLKATEQFDSKILDTLSSDVQQTREAVDNNSMKEVKGLEDRLYGLDQFMSGARKIVQEQGDMSKGFVQNQNRVSNLRDNSILPDLCASHKKQLLVMLNNHKKLRDIKKKCHMAKEELSVNLHTRLRWVMFVEKKICDVDGKLMIYRENLKRLQKRLDILQQIHAAPQVYAQLVVEVVRRRKFSTQFMEWASGLALESSQLHTDEVNRRQAFLSELGKHFLQSLFQGFEDNPPTFATEAPAEFDQRLPCITDDDIQMLRTAVPQLADKLSVPCVVTLGDRMTLHTIMSSVSDSTVQCDAMVCQNSPAPVCSSTGTSDIDIIQSQSDQQFVHIENSSLSLKDQVAACDITPDIKIKPQTSVIADRTDFPIPQSLSETLTQEMRSQTKLKEGKGGAGAKGVKSSQSADGVKYVKMSDSAEGLQSSGEPTKSSDSDIGSGDRSRESLSGKRRSGKRLTTDTSPELDTSQEFTTADFYFDESMPSSMTDSPPNKHGASEKVSINQQLAEKTQSVAKLEKELSESKKRLTNSQKRMSMLHGIASTDVPRLRESFCQLREAVVSDRKVLSEYVDSSVKSAVETLNCFQNNWEKQNDDTMQSLKCENDSEKSSLSGKLDETEKKYSELLKEVNSLQAKFETSVTDLEKFQSDSEQKYTELQAKHEEEKGEIICRHTLEQEVELDKVQSEFRAQLEQNECRLKELAEKTKEAEDKMKCCESEMESHMEQLQLKHQEEKEQLKHVLEEDFIVRQNEKINEMRKEEKETNEAIVVKLVQEHKHKLKEEAEKLSRAKEQALIGQKEELETSHKTHVNDITNQFRIELDERLKQKEAELERLHGESAAVLEKEHRNKVSEILQGFHEKEVEFAERLKQLDTSERSSIETQTDEHPIILVTEHRQHIEEQHQKHADDMQKALQDQRSAHDKVVQDLLQQLDKEKEDSLSMKTSQTAERQVQFNEAVSRVSQEKDKVIDDIRQNLQEQTDKFEMVAADKVNLERQMEENRIRMEDEQQEQRSTELQLRDEMSLLQQKLRQLEQQILMKSEISITPPDVKEGPSVTVIGSKTSVLENVIKYKDEEITKLQQRVMELSMTTSTRTLAQDKVSITSCTVGDLVLLCLDERHDQYVVFTIGTTLHFLHTECLDALGLKTGPGENRRSWVLAEITDKEYCQAKKSQNRFKVPVGTKFYRVKARPWSRDTTPKEAAFPGKAEASAHLS